MSEVLNKSTEALRQAFLTSLLRDEDKLDEPYLLSPAYGEKNSWTRRELAQEIQDNTEKGIEMMVSMMNLAAQLMLRENPSK